MEQIIVKSQKELDAIPIDYNGIIIIQFGTRYDRAIVNKKFKFSVEAWGNSSVEARGNSSVEARGNSSVVALENSSVEARGNSSVEAKHNSQVNDKSNAHKVTTSGNARIVYDPQDIKSYIETYELEHTDRTVRLFKAVHKRDGRYVADWNDFEYKIGEYAEADSLDADVREDCGHGIHMAYKEWCVSYGSAWNDLAILELETNIDGVIVPLVGSGKVRAAKAKVIREVPLEECGLYGKVLASRRK